MEAFVYAPGAVKGVAAGRADPPGTCPNVSFPINKTNASIVLFINANFLVIGLDFGDFITIA
jgi:hypothetical protein